MEIVKNTGEKGKLFINKLSAGERQLSAAIRMYFLEEEPLAIHTVASAAHNVLSDLLSHRGKDASIHGVIYGLLRAAKDLQEGELTEDEVRAWGEDALKTIRQYADMFAKDPKLDIDTVTSSAPPDFARAFWAEKRASYNYLKHADRDATSLLDEATINNEDTIVHAMTCSQHLNAKHTQEKHFFYCALISLGHLENLGDKPFDLEFLMRGMAREEIMALGRKNLCLRRYEGDGCVLQGALQKITDNSTRSGVEDVLFFNEG